MNFIKPVTKLISSKAGRQILTVQKHSPKILFAVGVVGIGATVFLACRATLKVEPVLTELEEVADKTEMQLKTSVEYTEKDRQRDLVKAYTKCVVKIAGLYAPAVAVGVVSIGALTGSHVILTRRNAGLTAAYAVLDKAFKGYRDRVSAELGPEKEREFWLGAEDHEFIEETKEGPVVKREKRATGMSPYSVVFDETNRNWEPAPNANLVFIRSQQNYMNDILRSRGHVLLNDVYDALGFPRTAAGCVVGWVYNKDTGDNYIDFGIADDHNRGGMDFIMGNERNVWIDPNVDGVIYELIGNN